MFIQTSYLPAEHIDFIDEWLLYHQSIGVEHFYLYDNTGSIGNAGHTNLKYGKNKYGHEITKEYILDKENEILNKYPVTKILWQPLNNLGQIYFDQVGAMDHYASIVTSGLTAFIDIDEFIVKREDFRESRLLQRKYDSRYHYPEKSVMNISNGFAIDTRHWATKCILDMSRYQKAVDAHLGDLNLPISESFFNHYNYNSVGHSWLLENYQDLDPSWVPVPYERVFRTMPTLRELSGFAG